MSASPVEKERPPIIDVRGLVYGYDGDHSLPVLDRIDLQVGAGEIICIVGPSGCGKTTLLQLIAGLLPVQSGRVSIDNGSQGLRMTMLFQDLRLFYWMTARQNVAIALQARGIDRRQASQEAIDYLARMRLQQFAESYPDELSGGMKQRLALARALATAAPVILLDEPFSNLDQSTQEAIEKDLLRAWRDEQLTLLMVTHDLWEAVRLADRILVLSPRPAAIRHSVDVTLPRPRTIDPKSLEVHSHIERLLYEN